MKTRSQRKFLDQLLPELVRAVLSCLRPADALPLARCSKHWRDACLSDWSLWRLWYVADFGPWRRGISPKHVWRGRYQRAWALRIEPGKRACGLTSERTSPRIVLALLCVQSHLEKRLTTNFLAAAASPYAMWKMKTSSTTCASQMTYPM